MKHTFAIAAYGESPYLEQCIRSLKEQTVPSEVILCTSTPNDLIRTMAQKYGLVLYENPEAGGIASDWNFAYAKASADLITIAHQDDVYDSSYTDSLLKAKEKYPDMSLYSTASITVREDTPKKNGPIELVKKLLRMPLRHPEKNADTKIKMKTVRYGNPLICPSCTYDRKLCGSDLFDSRYSFVVDWDALVHLAELPGRWICDETPRIRYRVHKGAATSQLIRNHVREKEEEEMFKRLLSPAAAKIYGMIYRISYGAYR